MNPLLHLGKLRIIRVFHVLDPLGGLGQVMLLEPEPLSKQCNDTQSLFWDSQQCIGVYTRGSGLSVETPYKIVRRVPLGKS